MNINEVLSKLIILQSQGVRQIYIKEKPVMITKLINDLHLIKIQKTHDLIHYFEFNPTIINNHNIVSITNH